MQDTKNECEVEKEKLNDLLEKPPIVKHAGARIMPEHFLPKGRGVAQTIMKGDIKDGKDKHDPGHFPTSQTWRAAFTTGGGHSKDVVWLRFSEDGEDTVIDVCFSSEQSFRQ